MRLFVANFPYRVTKEQLHELLSQYGVLLSLEIVTDYKGESRGFGYAEFTSKEDAESAMKALRGTTQFGRRFAIEPAKERKPKWTRS